MIRLFGLDARPYDRKAYIRSLRVIWYGTLLLAIPIGMISTIADDFVTNVCIIAIDVVATYFLYQAMALRAEGAGDSPRLAWLAVIPFLGFLFASIYISRIDKDTESISHKFSKRQLLLIVLMPSLLVSCIVGAMFTSYFQSIAWGIGTGISTGVVVAVSLLLRISSSGSESIVVQTRSARLKNAALGLSLLILAALLFFFAQSL